MSLNYRRIEEAVRSAEKEIENIARIFRPDFNTQFQLRNDVTKLKQLRIACISDRFTNDSFAPECEWLQLSFDNWYTEIDNFQPDLFLLESAWKGKDEKWRTQVSNPSPELTGLLVYCHKKQIPIVFWNKEDPVHTKQFLRVAEMCDYIFTTDVDCIPVYRERLGHNRIYHLHFAAQPAHQNPIETELRSDRISFAGSYYPRYEERNKMLWDYIQEIEKEKKVEIYDRNYYEKDTDQIFPLEWKPYIVGTLPFDEINHAYKGYRYSINMNSVTQSNSMFARRVFELMLSNTVVLSNYSRGLDNYFGNLVIAANSGKEMMKLLHRLEANDEYRYVRLRALRCVLQNHLYVDRLDEICAIVFGKHLKPKLPKVIVYCLHGQHKDLDKQKDVEFEAVPFGYPVPDESDIYVAVFDYECSYGEYYLLDLLLSTRYSDCLGFCKPEKTEAAYKFTDILSLKKGIVSASYLRNLGIQPEREIKITGHFLAIDEFNYNENNNVIAQQNVVHSPKQFLQSLQDSYLVIGEYTAKQIYDLIRKKSGEKYHVDMVGTRLQICSLLTGNGSSYIVTDLRIPKKQFEDTYQIRISYVASGSLHVSLCGWLISNKVCNRRGSAEFQPNQINTVDIPDYVDAVRIVIRIQGQGLGYIDNLRFLTPDKSSIHKIRCKSDTAIVTNNYPSYDNLYRNMFVHERALAYRKAGKSFDLICCQRQRQSDLYDEFEGISVVRTNPDGLDVVAGQVKTVCVHFLDGYMWSVLKKYLYKIKLIIWCHGSEIQPWWRREFNYDSEEAKEKAKRDSEERMAIWYDVFEASERADIKFVFVSEYFAHEVMSDYKVNLPKEKYKIIHNLINTELFSYQAKEPEQRMKLLSIRPYASPKYANDLTVKMIQYLREKPFFNHLEIRLIGKGPLFQPTLAVLNGYPNVAIEERFLTHDEIVSLHKQYGIFIVPTRMDAQGVSRDEAMSSGLVPITNAVTAIPEFCNDECAVMAPGEDAKAMADGVEKLYNNPALFLQMSANAAKRVRSQCSYIHTIKKEINLIWEDNTGDKSAELIQ